MISSYPNPTPEPHSPLHLVFVPFLERSHVVPLVATALSCIKRFAADVTVTILTTSTFTHLVPPSLAVHVVPFPTTDFAGVGEFALLPEPHMSAAFLAAAESSLAPALSTILHQLQPHTNTAVVADPIFHWSPALARHFGAPHVSFHIISLFAASAIAALDDDVSEKSEPFGIPGGFPFQVPIHKIRVPEVAARRHALRLFREAEAQSQAVVFNTFAAIEAACAEYYRRVGPRNVLMVGPTCLYSSTGHDDDVTGIRDPILAWLDARQQQAGSVVYVCFGSSCGFGHQQLRQLALGLQLCKRQFVWVVRTELSAEKWMLQGYDQIVRDRGLVVTGRWAPQKDILAHPAVGGFVGHCGWNSVTEGVCAGVPMATWPLRAEQFLNEEFVVEVLRIGVRVREVKEKKDVEEVVKAEVLARSVEELMGDGEMAEKRRRKAGGLGEESRKAVMEGGSSYEDLGCLIDGLRSLHNKRPQ